MGSIKQGDYLLNELHQMPEFDLSSPQSEQILANILATPVDPGVRIHPKRRRASPRLVTGGAAALVLIGVSGTLIYNVMLTSLKSAGRIDTPVKFVQSPSTPGEKYFKKTLGFQPMLPGYVPKGWRISDSLVESAENNGEHSATFQLYVRNEAAKSNYIQISEKKTPSKRSSLTVVSHLPLVVTVSRNNIQYDASYNGVSKNITADELKKMLESMTVKDRHGPSQVQTTVTWSGSLSSARKAADFKTVIPSFIPKGFTLVTGVHGPSAAHTAETRMTGSSSASPEMAGKSKNVSAFLDFTYAYGSKSPKRSMSPTKEQFNENSNTEASISISEAYTVPGNGNTPSGTLQTIQGHQVRLKEEKYPLINGSYTVYVYQWYDSATHVFFDIEGGDPSRQGFVDKAVMDQVVASMLR